ncbi:MAG: hypothetical protein M0Z53_00025 [Thermaerobacter sp.]|nr:hypothetical protein [Thermaerobacter sp.]
MKVTAIGTLTPAQQHQLAYDLLDFFYQAHRQEGKHRPTATAPDEPSATRHTPHP